MSTTPTKRSMAAGWEKWDGRHRHQVRQVVDWLLRSARVEPSMRVLDICCGTGQPLIPASERVRPGGRVVGIDHDPEMLAACQRLARQAGADNIELQQMDMHALNFPEGSFDAVTMCFGLMFARDPVKVMSEVRRVLRPGGRFALSVWGEPKRNPFFSTAFAALEVLGPQPPHDPKAPGPFRLAPNGELQSVLRAAGFPDFSFEALSLIYETPSLEEHWQMLRDMATPIANALDGKSEDDVAKVKAALFEAVAANVVEGKVRLQATPLCATAAR